MHRPPQEALPRRQCVAAVKRYGRALITHRPEDTTRLLMDLCIAGGRDKGGWGWRAREGWHVQGMCAGSARQLQACGTLGNAKLHTNNPCPLPLFFTRRRKQLYRQCG